MITDDQFKVLVLRTLLVIVRVLRNYGAVSEQARAEADPLEKELERIVHKEKSLGFD